MFSAIFEHSRHVCPYKSDVLIGYEKYIQILRNDGGTLIMTSLLIITLMLRNRFVEAAILNNWNNYSQNAHFPLLSTKIKPSSSGVILVSKNVLFGNIFSTHCGIMMQC